MMEALGDAVRHECLTGAGEHMIHPSAAIPPSFHPFCPPPPPTLSVPSLTSCLLCSHVPSSQVTHRRVRWGSSTSPG